MIEHLGSVHCSYQNITHILLIEDTSRLSSNIFEPPPENSLIPNQLAGDFLEVVMMVPSCESTNHITDSLISEQVPLCV